MMEFIRPSWPAPLHVKALTTLRTGGQSKGKYSSFNLALHVKDAPNAVALNRLHLKQHLNLKHEPIWLNQTHSAIVTQVEEQTQSPHPYGLQADGAFTQQKDVPCVILTGDCLPLLLCDTQGTVVGAIHAGWRGIMQGIIENAVDALKQRTQSDIMAWLGPAIGPKVYEVGEDVRGPFIHHDLQAAYAFTALPQSGKWLADIYKLAKLRLRLAGVKDIFGGEFCTYTDPERFYSYRREGETGRMATLIWLSA